MNNINLSIWYRALQEITANFILSNFSETKTNSNKVNN